MHPISASLNLVPIPLDFHAPVEHRRLVPIPTAVRPAQNRNAGRLASPSPRLTLAEACAREINASDRAETSTLLFLAGCAFAVVLGSALQLENCLAHWSWFENLVRSAL